MGLRPEGTQEIAGTFRVQFSPASHSEKGRMWRLEVTDDASCVHVLTLNMTMEQFGEAVSALSIRGVDGVVTVSPNHGKRCESKTLLVEVPSGAYRDWSAILDRVSAQHAVDGWQLQRGAYNTHRLTNGFYEFAFLRWVEV